MSCTLQKRFRFILAASFLLHSYLSVASEVKKPWFCLDDFIVYKIVPFSLGGHYWTMTIQGKRIGEHLSYKGSRQDGTFHVHR
jgi:hypothetical protein